MNSTLSKLEKNKKKPGTLKVQGDGACLPLNFFMIVGLYLLNAVQISNALLIFNIFS